MSACLFLASASRDKLANFVWLNVRVACGIGYGNLCLMYGNSEQVHAVLEFFGKSARVIVLWQWKTRLWWPRRPLRLDPAFRNATFRQLVLATWIWFRERAPCTTRESGRSASWMWHGSNGDPFIVFEHVLELELQKSIRIWLSEAAGLFLSRENCSGECGGRVALQSSRSWFFSRNRGLDHCSHILRTPNLATHTEPGTYHQFDGFGHDVPLKMVFHLL